MEFHKNLILQTRPMLGGKTQLLKFIIHKYLYVLKKTNRPGRPCKWLRFKEAHIQKCLLVKLNRRSVNASCRDTKACPQQNCPDSCSLLWMQLFAFLNIWAMSREASKKPIPLSIYLYIYLIMI